MAKLISTITIFMDTDIKELSVTVQTNAQGKWQEKSFNMKNSKEAEKMYFRIEQIVNKHAKKFGNLFGS